MMEPDSDKTQYCSAEKERWLGKVLQTKKRRGITIVGYLSTRVGRGSEVIVYCEK